MCRESTERYMKERHDISVKEVMQEESHDRKLRRDSFYSEFDLKKNRDRRPYEVASGRANLNVGMRCVRARCPLAMIACCDTAATPV